MSAVIDFGDAALDDPAIDFARLPATAPTFAESLLQHYDGDQRGLLRRAALYAVLERVVGRLDTSE